MHLENKTEFYFKYRVKLLKHNNISYNESNLFTFQDKLNYLLIHDNTELKTDSVYKIKIYQFIKKILRKKICIVILKIYKNEDEINLDELPQKFILKTNHGSEMNIIWKDKSKFNIIEPKNKLKRWKKMNYGLLQSEFQYFLVNRKIYAYLYLDYKLIDYEIYCFNNQQKFILVRKL